MSCEPNNNVLMPPAMNTTVLKATGYNNAQVVRLILQMIRLYKKQVKALAQSLKGKNDFESARNIYNAIRRHIAYNLDDETVQRVPTPARIWQDRKGDCKGMAVLAASLLDQLRIPYAVRFVRNPNEKRRGIYSHVYVVAHPGKGSKEIVIDPTISYFNANPPFVEKIDLVPGSEGMAVGCTSCSGRIGEPITMATALAIAKFAPVVIGGIRALIGGASRLGSGGGGTFYSNYMNALANLVERNGIADGRRIWQTGQRGTLDNPLATIALVANATTNPVWLAQINDWQDTRMSAIPSSTQWQTGTNAFGQPKYTSKQALVTAKSMVQAYTWVVNDNMALDRLILGEPTNLNGTSPGFYENVRAYIAQLAASGNTDAADILRKSFDVSAAQSSIFNTGANITIPGAAPAPASIAPATMSSGTGPTIVHASQGLISAQQQATPGMWSKIKPYLLPIGGAVAGLGIIYVITKK